jgi:hypothetical protein
MGLDAARPVQRRHARTKHALWAVVLVVATLAQAGEAPASVDPGADLKTCFWTDVAGRQQRNILLPDASARYWYSRFILPPGGRVVLRGDYPHARSFFLWNYHFVTPYDGFNDRKIAADAGSSNPFAAGADRTVGHRSYTLTVIGQPPPAAGRPRAANTIYAGTPGLAWLPQELQLLYRVYVPDDGRRPTGDAGLPDAQYVSPLGLRFSGEAACSLLQNRGATLPNLPPLATPAYLALLATSREPTHPAVTPIRWYAIFNDARLAQPFYEGTPLQGLIGALPATKTGPAVAPDADSAIAYTYVDRSLGPDPHGHNVLVLRGRLPTTPRTLHGEAQMASGTQMRYWSLCQNDSFVIGRVGDCLFDEQVPIDGDRRYTIVVSLPTDRPANATPACGVAWLDYGTLGDGVVKPRAGLLLLRNQLADPSFAPGIANVTVPGTEARVVGDYLPSGEYESRAQFEASGCQ